VVPLSKSSDNMRRFAKGDDVFAIYPETTSFYPGNITQMPKRANLQPGEDPQAFVQFQDDMDEFGVTPQRPVPLHLIFKLG
jgi:SAGA-associated factor 29